MDKKKPSRLQRWRRKRLAIQSLGALLLNGHWKGFVEGQIYKGPTKALCVPVLNCYSCPGALGACPIGSLQAVTNDAKFQFSFLVVGFLALCGITLGRWFCGWLCPFGWIQEWLHKIPLAKWKVPPRIHRVATKLKYVFLGGFVFLLPLLFQDAHGLSDPFFCKWICPAGTLEAGLPLVAANSGLQSALGAIFSWKVFLLILTVFGCIRILRFFCKYACPLGAFYGLFNPYSFYQLKVDKTCTRCSACTRVCPMDLTPWQTPNSPECIRCGDCVKVCPEGAIRSNICSKRCKKAEKSC